MKLYTAIALSVIVLVCGVCVSNTYGGTVSVEILPDSDTFLREGNRNDNQGGKSYLRIQDENISHVVLHFATDDILAAVDNRPIVSAYVQLYIETNFTNWSSGAILNLYRMNATWSEMGATWNCSNDSDTSNNNADCSTMWGGGYYESLPTASILQTNNSIGPQVLFVTEDVQTMITGGYNYGWLLKKINYADRGSADYGSRDGVTGHRPKLIIEVEESDDESDVYGPNSGTNVWIFPNPGTVDYANGLFGSTGVDCSSFSPDQWFGSRTANLDVFMFGREMVDGPGVCGYCDQNSLYNFRQKNAFCKLIGANKKIAMASAVITPPSACDGIANKTGAMAGIRNIQCNDDGSCCNSNPKNCAGAGGHVKYVDMDEPLFRAFYADTNCNMSMNDAALVVKNFIEQVNQPADIDVEVGLTEPWRICCNPRSDTWNASVNIITQWVDALIGQNVNLAFFHLDVDPKRSDLNQLGADLSVLKAYFSGKGIPFGVLYTGGDDVNDTQWYNNAMNVVNKTSAAIGRPDQNLFMSYTEPRTVPHNLPECGSNTLTRALNDGWSQLKGNTKNSTFNSQSNDATNPLAPGGHRTVSLTFTNTGKTTWQSPSSTDGSTYYLLYQPTVVNRPCSVASLDWGWLGGIPVPAGTCVAPGNSITFTFEITAPTIPGTYEFRWRLAREDQDGRVTKFGAFSVSPPPNTSGCIEVSTNPVPGITTLITPADEATTTTRPTLTWNPVIVNPPVTNYEVLIERNDTGDDADNPLLGNVVSYVVPSGRLQAGYTYRWQVRAKNANGFGIWSSSFRFSIPTTQTYVKIDMGASDVEEGISRPSPEPGDGETFATSKTNQCNGNGVSLRKNRGTGGTTGSDDLYFYFKVENSFINGSAPPIDLSVQYYDQTDTGWGTQMCLQYRKANGTWVDNICETLGNTKCMKTWVKTNITDAYFGGTLPGGSDFRIWCGGSGSSANTTRFLNVVTITKR